MNVEQMKRASKAELLERISILDGKIDYTTRVGGKNKVTLTALRKEKQQIRRYAYECVNCSEAKVKTMTNSVGEERDYLAHDCGKENCPYHDYFMQKDYDKDFEKFFKNYLKLV